MKNTIAILFLFLSSTFLLGQTEVMELKSFDVLDVATNVKVLLYKGEPRAEITMIKGDIEDLLVENKSGVLKIKFKNKSKWGWSSSGNQKAEIKLYTSALRGVEVSASARVIADDAFQSEKFYVEASSSGYVDMEVQAQSVSVDVSSSGKANIDVRGNSKKMNLEVSSSGSANIEGYTQSINAEVSSSGTLNIDGSTDKLNVDVSSSGVFKGSDMRARKVIVDATSSGSAKVWSEESITASTSSSGVVKYSGNPTEENLDKNKSGGTIKKIK